MAVTIHENSKQKTITLFCELMNQQEEIKCIKAFSHGNERAFEVLFLNYQPKLIAFVDGFVKDYELSRDICQDVFLRLWENRERYNEIKSFKAFLFKTAKFYIFNHFDHLLVNEKYVDYVLDAPIEPTSIEDSLFAKDLEDLINLAIQNMPEQRRKVFSLSRVEGLTNDEIAEKLGISKRTVENHITTALAMLRKITIFALFFFSN